MRIRRDWSFCAFIGVFVVMSAGLQAAQQPARTEVRVVGAKATAGRWQSARGGIRGEGFLDNRLLLEQLAPASLLWNVDIKLEAGRAAGVLFWANDDGSKAYSVRLDSRLGQLILSRTGNWPEETRLAVYPWGLLDGPSVNVRIVAGNGTIRVAVPAKGDYPLLEARKVAPFGNRIGLHLMDASATFKPGQPAAAKDAPTIKAHMPQVGEFQHIYDASVGEKEPWYINDHCFIHGADGWHLFGITHAKPAAPMEEKDFAHATAGSLVQYPWVKQPYALRTDPSVGENHLWAPHVIKRRDTYYMFYCAGSRQGNYHYRIHLATSKDLKTWTRHPDNPVFQDFYDARDPMVLEDMGTYYLYYTANLDREQNHHVVLLRTSKDLLKWTPARVALTHPEKGTFGGPTESPFVVKIGDHFYLFCGPDGDYHRTVVYRSPNPYHWEHAEQIYAFPSHAAEVVQDVDGKWYASNAGWDAEGIYLAPLTWREEE